MPGVGLERARHRADQVLPRLVELLRRQRRRGAAASSSSSIDATARSTFAGLTPARIVSGPCDDVRVERAGHVVRHPLPLADAVAQPAADRVLAEHVVHQPVGVVRRIAARDRREAVGDVGLRLVHHRDHDAAALGRRRDAAARRPPAAPACPPAAEHARRRRRAHAPASTSPTIDRA